jgi:hypothetical protein
MSTNANNNKDHTISFRVSKRVLDRAAEIAEQEGQKIGEIARLGLLRYVESKEREARRG